MCIPAATKLDPSITLSLIHVNMDASDYMTSRRFCSGFAQAGSGLAWIALALLTPAQGPPVYPLRQRSC